MACVRMNRMRSGPLSRTIAFVSRGAQKGLFCEVGRSQAFWGGSGGPFKRALARMTRCHLWEGCRAAAPSECAPDEGGNQHALRDAIRDAISTFRMRASSSSLIGFAPFTISFASFLCSSCQIRTTLAQLRRCSQAIRHSQAIRPSVELVAADQMNRISYSELTGNQALSGARRGGPDESYLVLRAHRQSGTQWSSSRRTR